MNGVALFAGIAGLDLGLNQIMPDSRTVCYVEGETYAAQVLHAKMLKGELPHAPIYSDVRSFPSVAHHFAQKVDFITAGFPCQPFSNAGSRKGTKDERWLWDSILETIREVRPSYLFLENVSNLLNEWGAFDEISKSLAKIGFNLEWGLVRASDVGANHQRNRLFIFAYIPSQLYRIRQQLCNPKNDPSNTDCDGLLEQTSTSTHDSERINQEERVSGNQFIKSTPSYAHPNGERRTQPDLSKIPIEKGIFGRENNESSNPNGFGWFKEFQKIRGGKFNVIWEGVTITNPDRFGHNGRGSEGGSIKENGPKIEGKCYSNFQPSWWRGEPPFPPVCRVDDGISYGLDRLRALGNAVVPLQAAHAFYALIQRAINHPSRF